MSKSRGRHKGMVSVDGITYRIERIASRKYGVVRLNDDVHVGTFTTGRQIQVSPEGIAAGLLEMIARDAIMTAKTSWVMHPIPEPPKPEPGTESETGEQPVSTRRRFAPA